jgi:hypothetical protein
MHRHHRSTCERTFSGRFGELFHEAGGDFYFPGGLEEIGVDWAGKFLAPVLTECINGAGPKIIPAERNQGLGHEPRRDGNNRTRPQDFVAHRKYTHVSFKVTNYSIYF